MEERSRSVDDVSERRSGRYIESFEGAALEVGFTEI
jgi:hypothetical protein